MQFTSDSPKKPTTTTPTPKKKKEKKKRKREWKRPTTKNLFQSQTNWNEIRSHLDLVLEPKKNKTLFPALATYITILRILTTILPSLSLSLCLGCLTLSFLPKKKKKNPLFPRFVFVLSNKIFVAFWDFIVGSIFNAHIYIYIYIYLCCFTFSFVWF